LVSNDLRAAIHNKKCCLIYLAVFSSSSEMSQLIACELQLDFTPANSDDEESD